MKDSIAIIGMACVYPGAHSPEQLWENVLAGRPLRASGATGRRERPRKQENIGNKHESPRESKHNHKDIVKRIPFGTLDFPLARPNQHLTPGITSFVLMALDKKV